MKHLILAISLFSVSCVSNNDRINSMTYFRDSKTGLCFAAQALGFNNAVMTNVTCTPEVERLIKGDGK